MSRVRFSAIAWLALGWLGCAPSPVATPHVLLITVDTLRPDYLSMNGYDRATTPKLDEILAEGFYFEQAVAPVGRTTPSLASLLTGGYPHTTGVRTLTDGLEKRLTTLPQLLHDAGYQSVAVVSNQVLVRARGLDRGFDVYDMAGDDRDAKTTTDAVLGYFAELDPEKPTLTWVHYIDPHAPYHTDPAIASQFDPGYTGRYRFHFGWRKQPGQDNTAHSAFPEDLPKQIATHRNPLPAAVNAHIRRLYAADIRSLDDEIGRLVAAARERFGDEILIVFTADHGESLGEHDFYFDHGDYVYNAGTRVPLAIVLPRSHELAGSGRCRGWVSLVDVVPTVLELLGRELPDPRSGQLEGRSLAACLRGETLPPTAVFAESGHSFFPGYVRGRVRNDVAGRFRSVTLGDWKLIWTPFASGPHTWQLYDVANDPDETRNLYHEGHEVLPPLKEALAVWMQRAEPTAEARAMSDEDIEALRQLGYMPNTTEEGD